jgi:hypothetical protein
MRATPFIAFVIFLVAMVVVVDPGVSYALANPDITHTIAGTFHPFEAVLGTALAIEPISVGTKTAWHMMGISNAHGYKLIEQGEIDSYLEGRVRKVTVASIKAYIERKLAAARKDAGGPVRTEKATAASVARRAKRKADGTPGRGRPRLMKAPPAPTPAPIEHAAVNESVAQA